MEYMTGRWAWRGKRGRGAGAAAPGGTDDGAPDQGGAAAGDAAAATTLPAPGQLPREPLVPSWLGRAAAWSWRLLVVGLLIYVVFRVASTLQLVILPCIAALLLTALLHPVAAGLRHRGMPSLAATWSTVLAGIVVLAGLTILVVDRVTADYSMLQSEVKHTAREVQHSLAGAPFHVSSARLAQYYGDLVRFLSGHKSLIAGTVVTGGRIVLELAAGVVLTIFVMFFLLKDGERIWRWITKGLPSEARRRADDAGTAAWGVLVNYMRGTTAVAAIHAIFIGVALWVLGVPLLLPLIILVFIAAYLPLVGIFVAGTVVILVTLGTKGWIAAAIMIGVFILEGQIEGHLLQPLLIGRVVRLHPLAIILVLALGGVIGGIAGAIVAVPAAAAVTYAWPHLRGQASPAGPAGPAAGPGSAAPPGDGP
jgi:predicted PurR-regulated permease PerM